MRSAALAASFALLHVLGTAAAEPAWHAAPLPPEAVQFNRQAEAAATPAEAARLYAQSLRLEPANGPALHGLGCALLDLDRPADSQQVLRRLDAIHPGDAATLTLLARTATRLPDPRRADVHDGIAWAGQALEADPRSPAAWHILSVLLHLDGEYAAAREAAARAVELDAQSPSDPATTALYQQQEIACNNALLVFSPLD